MTDKEIRLEIAKAVIMSGSSIETAKMMYNWVCGSTASTEIDLDSVKVSELEHLKGFLKDMESMEDEDVALQRLNEESGILKDFCEAEGYNPETAKSMSRSLKKKTGFDIKGVPDEEPLVKLKPDAILKRRLKQQDFNTKVWRTLVTLNIETLGDILQVSEKFYLSQKGFGMGSLNVLRNYVKQFGYKLKEK